MKKDGRRAWREIIQDLNGSVTLEKIQEKGNKKGG